MWALRFIDFIYTLYSDTYQICLNATVRQGAVFNQ